MITFEISKNVYDLFDFTTSYYDLNQTEILISWRKYGIQYPKYSIDSNTEKITYEIDVNDLPSDEQNAFSYFFNDVLKVDKSIWLECHIKEFCIQKLNTIIKELSGHTEHLTGSTDISIRKRRKGDPNSKLPQEFNDYLYSEATEAAAYQYEVAFRNHIVPDLKNSTGENFWDIKDLDRLAAMKDSAKGLTKTALKYYINYLLKDTKKPQTEKIVVFEGKKEIDLSKFSKSQRGLYDFIIANGRCQPNGAYQYVYYNGRKIKEISGFDMYDESDPEVVKQWRDEFKIGKYAEINEKRHHFPSTALDWYYKYLLSL